MHKHLVFDLRRLQTGLQRVRCHSLCVTTSSNARRSQQHQQQLNSRSSSSDHDQRRPSPCIACRYSRNRTTGHACGGVDTSASNSPQPNLPWRGPQHCTAGPGHCRWWVAGLDTSHPGSLVRCMPLARPQCTTRVLCERGSSCSCMAFMETSTLADVTASWGLLKRALWTSSPCHPRAAVGYDTNRELVSDQTCAWLFVMQVWTHTWSSLAAHPHRLCRI